MIRGRGRPAAWRPAAPAAKPWLYPAVFCAVLATYAWSAPRTVVLEDDGLFITAAYFNSVAHPPGYPLYTALAHLATLVPLGTVALRVHMLTALFGALACVTLLCISLPLVRNAYHASAAALAFGFSLTFWSQSIIAEVYTLNTLLFLLLLAGALFGDPERPGRRPGAVFALGLVYGLSLSNHWPLMLLSSPALAVLYWPYRSLLWRGWPMLGAGLCIGLCPYAWLVYRTQVVPEQSMYGPIRDFADFWFVISRAAYRTVDSSPSAGWGDKARFAGFTLAELARQFGPAGFVPLFAGFIVQWRLWPRRLCAALLLAFAGSTLVLIALLRFDFDLLHMNVFRVYPLIAFCVAALWLGLGLRWIALKALGPLRHRVALRLIHLSMAIVLVGTTWLAGAPENYRAADTWAERYITALLQSLPRGAMLFANGDIAIGPARYLHWVQGLRPDIRLTSVSFLMLPGGIPRLYLLPRSAAEAVLQDLARREPAGIYYTNDYPAAFGVEDFGLFMKTRPDLPADEVWATAVPSVVGYFNEVLRGPPPRDPWERMHYLWMRVDDCRLWANLNVASLPARIRSGRMVPCNHFGGRLLLVHVLLAEHSTETGLMLQLLADADRSRGEAVTKKDASEVSLLRGDVALRMGQREEAAADFRTSIGIWPHPDNPARERLSGMREHDN